MKRAQNGYEDLERDAIAAMTPSSLDCDHRVEITTGLEDGRPIDRTISCRSPIKSFTES
jgi:hypothetical protein